MRAYFFCNKGFLLALESFIIGDTQLAFETYLRSYKME